jgi:anti-sigma factor RsiW
MGRCDTGQLLLLASGELDAREAADLARHVDGCDECRTELARIREGLARLEGLSPLEPSAFAARRIVAEGRKAVARRRRTTRPSFVRRYRYALAAAALVTLALGLSLLRPAGPGGPDWNRAMSDVYETSAIVDDLAEQYEASPWTVAADAEIARLSEWDLDDALLDLEESLELIEALSWDS